MPAQRSNKHDYAEQIRSDSAYPTFRSLIKLVVALLYLFGIVTILGAIRALAGGRITDIGSVVTAIAVIAIGVAQIVGAKFFGEASVMLADIADSILEFNSRKAPADQDRREDWSL